MDVVGIKPHDREKGSSHDESLCHMTYQTLLAMFKVSPLMYIYLHDNGVTLSLH